MRVHASFCVLLYSSVLYAVIQSESCDRKSSCSCECSQGIVDISGLGTTNGPRYKDFAALDQYKYSYNPCDPFTETNPLAFADYCHDVAACQVIENSGTFQYYDTGTQDSVTFYTENGQDAGLVDIDSQVVVAKYTSLDNARQTEVILVCNDQDDKTAFDTFGEVPNATPLYRFILVSPLCCFTPAGGLSVGSILLIIFFSSMVFYLIAGVAVNKFRNNLSGKELLPNTDFWTSLPTLIKDGCLFVIKRGEYQAIK